MISVIVLTYNQERTIGRALDSILSQQCNEEIEIRLSDDASSDSTPAICQAYANRYPDIIRLTLNQRNKGIVNNYFDTLLACQGELIADLAGDDQWCDPLKLEKERNVMANHPDVTLVHTAWRRRYEDSDELSQPVHSQFSAPVTDGRLMLESIITQTTQPVIHLCTALYRKSVFLKEYAAHNELFRNEEYSCEDLQLTFFMALNGNIAYLPDVTLLYTSSSGSISNNHNDGARQFLFFHRVTNLSHRLSTLFGISSDNTAAFFSLRVFELLMHSFRAHRPDLRNLALQDQHRWQAPTTLRIFLARLVTSNAPTWHSALLLRKLVKAFRQ